MPVSDHPFGARGPAEPAPLALPLALEPPRFELVPIRGALEAADHLPRNAEVTVSCSPTLGIENTLALAEELSGRDFRVVGHLAARLVTGEAHLSKLVRRMDDSGLREVLVVGGDAKEGRARPARSHGPHSDPRIDRATGRWTFRGLLEQETRTRGSSPWQEALTS